MSILRNVQPLNVFHYFEEISNIPRGSGNEKNLSDYIVNFAKARNLYFYQDDLYNVILKKDCTKGYENSDTVIIQGHMDMVCEKNKNVEHNFEKEGIKLRLEGDFISADGTTLGADNGIAVAYMLAIIDSDDIEHPNLEFIFTVSEESGLQGAMNIDTSIINGKKLINLDSEEEGKIVVSCCGGMKVTTELPVKFEYLDSHLKPYSLKIRGLKGGHSGSDIHLQRANAIKLMGRIIYALKEFDFKLSQIDGGLMDNAIPRECDAIIFINENDFNNINMVINNIQNDFIKEYRKVDDCINISFKKIECDIEYKAFDEKSKSAIIDILIMIPYGVMTMNMFIKDVVESSSNIGILTTEQNSVKFVSSVRSAISSRKDLIYNIIYTLGKLSGAKSIATSSYPAWEFNESSDILDKAKSVFKQYYDKDAIIESIHAGLECGIFAEKIKGIDMISIGPDMFDVHTPYEKLSVSSTKRVWEVLKLLLKSLK